MKCQRVQPLIPIEEHRLTGEDNSYGLGFTILGKDQFEALVIAGQKEQATPVGQPREINRSIGAFKDADRRAPLEIIGMDTANGRATAMLN